LEAEILPRILALKGAEQQVRVWVVGCATGEEAYSLAMLLAERTMGVADAPGVQIFATDIDEHAITVAREGYYTLNDAADVSPERLRRFFTKEGDGFRVRRELREMILFAHHNVIKDPPFSHLDLITCRNLLIYLNQTAQNRVMETFHFALNPGGYLFVGNSESTDGAGDLYATVSKEHHVYQCREATTRIAYPVPELSPPRLHDKSRPLEALQRQQARALEHISYGDLHQRLLEQYAPPSVLVNENFDILHLSERAGRYLQVAGGEPSQNLLKLIRPEMRLELRTALYQAVQRQTNVEAKNLRVRVGDRVETVNVYVRPVLRAADDTARGFILVLFAEAADGGEAAEAVYSSPEPVARQLEEELVRSKAQLRASVEQFELQAEELKSSNEELQALNEELRSSAEELETSKEELQSLNEELRTVNQELKVKLEEASQTSSDLQNFINSTDIGTIFLDRSFRVSLFTPAARHIFNLIPADYGRPLSDITSRLVDVNLVPLAEAVIETLQPVEREAQTSDGRTFLMRLTPYRTAEDRINGVVISFINITERRRAEERLRESEERLRLMIESAKDYAIFTLDLGRRVSSWNAGAEAMFGYAEGEIVGQSGDILFTPEDRAKGAPEREAEIALTAGVAVNERFHQRKDGSRFWGSGLTRPLRDEAGETAGFVKVMRDLTEAKRAEDALRASEEKYRALFDSIDEGYLLCEVIFDENEKPIDILHLEANPAAVRLAGRDFAGRRMREIDPDYEEYWYEIIGRVALTGEAVRAEHFAQPHGRWFDFYASKVGGQESRRVASVFQDITERKQREREQEFLLKLSDALRPLSDAEEIEITACRVLGEWLGAHRVYYVEIFEPEGVATVRKQYLRAGATSIAGDYPIAAYGWAAPPLRRGEAVVVSDVYHSDLVPPEYIAAMEAVQQTSIVLVPLVKKGEWLGVLAAGEDAPRDWKEEDVALARETLERMWAAAQRARAEEALRESEEQFRRAIEEAPIPVIMHAEDGEVLQISRSWTELTGYTLEDKDVLQTWLTRAYGFGGEGVRDAMEQSFAPQAGAPMRAVVFDITTRQGEHRTWSFSASTPGTLGDGRRFVVGMAEDITERKRAEEALRESEGKLRALVENLPGGAVFVLDHDLRYLVAEGEALAGTGFKAADLVGRTVAEAMPPELVARYEPQFRRALAGEAFEHEHDAHGRSYLSRGVPLTDAEGKVYAVLAISYDITGRKRAEEARRESERRLRRAAEIETVGMLFFDPAGVFTDCNDAFLKMSGFTREQVARRRVSTKDMTLPEWMPRTEQALEELKATGRITPYEKELQRPDGSRWWGLFAGTRLSEAESVEFVIDVTERKRAEESFRASEERLRLVVESMPDYAIFTTDAEGRIVTWNPGAERTFGFTEAEAVGQHTTFIFTPEDRERGAPEEEMRQAREAGRAADERWHLHKDGSRFYVSGVLAPLCDGAGRLTGYAKIARDLTERKRLEDELRQARAELEARVAERTHELWQANVALRRENEVRAAAEERARALLRQIVTVQEDERRRIARDLHDQLGQQLTALRLKIELHKESCSGDQKRREEIEQIGAVAEQIDAEIDFLAWELRPSGLDALGLPATLGNYVAQWSKHYDIQAEFHTSGIGETRLDPKAETHLYRIAQEALNNVVKHAAAGRVSVILERLGEAIVLIVEDDGRGFTPEEVPAAPSERGLGLIGMQERASLIGGTFQIESAPGSGTTVFVSIPAAGSEEKGGE
jgi:PAS domain S-box-containing protein